MQCAADQCESETKSGSSPWCNKHYRRMLKRGTVADPVPAKCAVDECPDLAKPGRKGWCHKHWKRWHKYGDPLAVAFIIGDDEARFWSKVGKHGPVPAHAPELGPCWPWAGGCDDAGYGVFYYTDENGVRHRGRAHRWLLGHLRGKPLSREVAGEEDGCHHCDNPPCCNPDHLYLGTRKQNVGDAVERSRLWQLKKDECPQGHPLDGVKTQNGKRRRYCKTCERDSSHKRRTLDRTHCKNGHPLEGDNVILCKNGTRKCRICDVARLAKSHASRYGSKG